MMPGIDPGWVFVYFYSVVFTFDPAERERNLPFERVGETDWAAARIAEDTRRAWGERRFRAFGERDGRLHIAVFTPRGGALRIISFRRASRLEEAVYGRWTQRSG